jgi:lipopolysaccharide transport system ATP-binding protein
MSSEDFSIRVEGLSKRYEIYAQPVDRLKQMILPRAQRAAGRPARNYFSEFWAVRDVSFDVRRGETVGIVGRNGSGKSTLLQMICGTLHPTLGTIAVSGRIAALLELGAGFNPEFTGRENVRLSGLLYGLSERELNARFDAILDFAEIGEFIDQPVKTYSSGMYVRLAFSVAINVAPDVLVVDEALSVGDEAFQRKCFARIEAIRESGATVLFVSHAAGMVVELCNRAILLDGGELLAQGLPKTIVSRYHKLLYAPGHSVAAVRDQIRGGESRVECEPGIESTNAGRRPRAGNASSPPDECWLDEGLVPRSTLRYTDRGATIGQPCVTNEHGRRVNVLHAGGEYVYSFNVTIRKPALGVRFGMAIKTTTGFALGGATTAANAGEGLMTSPDQEYRVRFRFRALLAPGVYFLNAGVTAAEPEGEVFLDRIIDAVMIRIMPDSRRLATELVDFDVRPDVEMAALAP